MNRHSLSKSEENISEVLAVCRWWDWFLQRPKLIRNWWANRSSNLKRSKLSFEVLTQCWLAIFNIESCCWNVIGGEAQRIRLATQIGSNLSGVLYILDEPSIGLHQRDNDRLIESLKSMRDLGNTLIVVEHDEDTMRAKRTTWLISVQVRVNSVVRLSLLGLKRSGEE